MAFWGVEVKSAKSFTHFCEKARGRLKITQATLGLGDATKKSVVQCNVGRRSPVLLCVLIPNQTESLNLDLEFDEAEDVVFSVIGPRSVYLNGYYLSRTLQHSPQSDTESYGVNIEHSEGSSYCSEDDKYENSFIDDGESEAHLSPDSKSRGSMKLMDRKDRSKSLRKKNHVVYSDDIHGKSEDKNEYLLNIFNSRKATNSASTGDEKNQVMNDVPNDAEALEEIMVNKEVSADKNVNEKSMEQNNNRPSAHLKKKRKPCCEEEKTCEVQNEKDRSVLGEDKEHDVQDFRRMETVTSSAVAPPESCSEDRKRPKKRKKELQSKGVCTKGVSGAIHNTDSNGQMVTIGDTGAKNDNTNSEADASQLKKKTKKKTKKKSGEGDINMGLLDMTANPENSLAKSQDQTSDANPIQSRTLSNGLIIEELAYGPPNGKAATVGKKVKIHYTAKSKENGCILDTNVGKTACKLLLESDGWTYGINGMRVGDKRRLTVPPSLCSGIHGAGENLPPNTWILYEVELVAVRK